MIVVAKMKAKAGQEDAMEAALRKVIPDVAKEEGTLTYTLHRGKKDKSVFLFYEKYRDKEALKAHSATPHFNALFGAIGGMLDGAPEIEMFDEVDGIPLKG